MKRCPKGYKRENNNCVSKTKNLILIPKPQTPEGRIAMFGYKGIKETFAEQGYEFLGGTSDYYLCKKVK